MISARVNEDRYRKNMAAGPCPPGGEASFHRRKDDGGGVNGHRHDAEKIWLQVLTPSGRQETGLRLKDDGGGLDDRRHQLTRRMEKNYRCRSYTPRGPAGNGTPVKGRWGWSR